VARRHGRSSSENFGRGAQEHKVKVSSRAEAVEHLLSTLWQGKQAAIASPAEISAVGHRVVHGGPKYQEPALVISEVKVGIAEVSAFAPLHNRAELEGMAFTAECLRRPPPIPARISGSKVGFTGTDSTASIINIVLGVPRGFWDGT